MTALFTTNTTSQLVEDEDELDQLIRDAREAGASYTVSPL